MHYRRNTDLRQACRYALQTLIATQAAHPTVITQKAQDALTLALGQPIDVDCALCGSTSRIGHSRQADAYLCARCRQKASTRRQLR